MTQKVIIIGAGGHAREVLDICDACNQEKPSFEVLGYIVDLQYGSPSTLVNDLPILGDFEWLRKHYSQEGVVCAVGDPHHRYHLIQRANEIGCQFINLIHPSVILTRWVFLGNGVIITAGCILTNQIRIGNHVHINLACTISHDAVLEDFVTLSPGVHISGNVHLKTGCFVGIGANIIPKLNLGEWSIVGAGSTIVKDVPPNTTVVGVPGRAIKTREPGWYLKSDES